MKEGIIEAISFMGNKQQNLLYADTPLWPTCASVDKMTMYKRRQCINVAKVGKVRWILK